jgi:hypothetical protein
MIQLVARMLFALALGYLLVTAVHSTLVLAHWP